MEPSGTILVGLVWDPSIGLIPNKKKGSIIPCNHQPTEVLNTAQMAMPKHSNCLFFFPLKSIKPLGGCSIVMIGQVEWSHMLYLYVKDYGSTQKKQHHIALGCEETEMDTSDLNFLRNQVLTNEKPIKQSMYIYIYNVSYIICIYIYIQPTSWIRLRKQAGSSSCDFMLLLNSLLLKPPRKNTLMRSAQWH